MARTLIVVDLQVDFCPEGRLAVAGGDEIVAPINRMMTDFETIILTQDWHPQNHSSFASNQLGAAPFSLTQMDYGPQVLWPDHCVIGSKGAEFHPDLDISRAQAVIRKGFRQAIDSYSAFFENDYKTPTGLAGYLRERELDDLYFVGLAYDFCVAWSAVDAARLGFRVNVIEQATRAIDLDGSRGAARKNMLAAGVTLI